MTHIYNLKVVFTSAVLHIGKLETLRRLPVMEENHQLVIDKTIVSFLCKYLKKVHLDLMLKRVSIFRKFNVNGKFIPQLWSYDHLLCYSGQYKVIRRCPGFYFVLVNNSSMYFGANLFCCLKIWVVTFCSNLALTGSQFISLNS